MDGNHNFNAFYNWMKNAEPSNDQNTQTSQNSSNPAPFPDMGNISMHPLPIHFAPRVANMGNPFAMSSQNWGNFQHVINPTMYGGASAESSADQRPQTPTGVVEESQVPNLSSDVDANARIGEEGGRVNGHSNQKVRFTLAENTLLIQSWLNISKDPIKGNDQKSDTFWSRITENYNEYRGNSPERGLGALKNRWQKINSAVQKFIGCYNQATARKKSGTSENDVLQDAYTIFNQDEKELFKFEYAWRLLKDDPKWNSQWGSDSSKRTKKSASRDTSTPASDAPTSHLLRPIGIKKEKKKAKAAKSQDASSLLVELRAMQESQKERLAEIAELKQQKETHFQIRERELTFKEYEIIMKDTSEMTETQLQFHTELCKKIKEVHKLD